VYKIVSEEMTTYYVRGMFEHVTYFNITAFMNIYTVFSMFIFCYLSKVDIVNQV